MATPPFVISEDSPSPTDFISAYPADETAFRDVVESWLTMISDPTTGLLKPSGFPSPFELENTDAGVAAGPVFNLYRNSASPTANDLLGEIFFYGNDSTGVKTVFADFYTTLLDPTNGSEDGSLTFRAVAAGTLTPRLVLHQTGADITGVLDVSGSVEAPQLLSGSTASAVTVSGGTNANGGHILLFGSTHATNPNDVVYRGDHIFQTTAGVNGPVIMGALTATTGTFSGALSATSGTFSAGVSGTTGTFSGAVSGTTGTFNGKVKSSQIFEGATTSTVIQNATAGTLFFRPNAGVATGQTTIDASGDLVASGDITAFSDERLKYNVEEIDDYLAMRAVRHIKPVSFKRTDTGHDGIGFIAQDVARFFPELVKTDDAGFLSLAYGNMVAVLWREVQRLQKIVETL